MRGRRSPATKRVGKPAMFLASPMAEFITDKVLAVNGGSSAGRPFLPLSTPLSS